MLFYFKKKDGTACIKALSVISSLFFLCKLCQREEKRWKLFHFLKEFVLCYDQGDDMIGSIFLYNG